MVSMDSWVDHRYRLKEKLGAGGMGEVYRAEDRLTGQVVALKRVILPAEDLQFASRGSSQEAEALRLSLAREFQTLASLRHPNIISVRDYGFDTHQQPYFTMEYLAGAQTLVDAGRDTPPGTQIDLLLQMLQALAYLHRRGILHRDLKPGNVLVKDGVVRVLDFGLSADRGSVTGISGTFEYMAPEVLREEPISEAADLYAVGMMAYEMMAGKYPFTAPNISQLLVHILTTMPEFNGLSAPSALITVVRRLLQKAPAQRYASADKVIGALRSAAQRPPIAESPAIRESFLQAASFTGRDAELASLTQALDEAHRGHGSAWLIGGESGVGKSRLLDELRTRALVGGALVLRGFASEGSLPYQLWREVLPRLVISTTLSDLEAAVLKPLVPNIGELLGHDIPDAPEAAASAAQQRLALTIDDLFRRQTHPLLLLLEDLQWAEDGLDILKQIARTLSDTPLLIVATYRDDETPSLPSTLAQMKPMRLERLSDLQIRELSTSMLGEAGHNPRVLALLQKETEGNVLFIVEVLRALAEDAGRLSDIGKDSLPDRVMAGGIQMILRRRLGRMPIEHQPLLVQTAIAGRHADLAVMKHLADPKQLDDFFIAGANVGVFEFRDGRWVFTHDKLRETLLADLPAEQFPGLHRRAAEAVEAAHPEDKAYTPVLADHWRAAGDAPKELSYLPDAATQMYNASSFSEAQRYAERGLELTEHVDISLSTDEISALRTEFYRQVGNAHERQAEYPHALTAYQESLRLAEDRGDDRSRAAAMISLAHIAQTTGDNLTGHQYAEQGVALFRMLGDEAGVAQGLIELAFTINDYAEAKQILTDALGIARKLDKPVMEGRILNNIGIMSADLGELTFARECYIEALGKLHAAGERHSAAGVLNNLGLAAFLQGDFNEAQQHFEQALVLNEQMGARSGLAHSLSNLGMVSKDTGQYEQARQYHERALDLYREIGNPWGTALNLHHLAKLNAIDGKHQIASELYSESLALFCEIDNPWGMALALGSTAWNDMKLGDYDAARTHLVEALKAAKKIGSEPRLLWGLRTAIELELLIGDAERGAEWLGLVLNHPASEQTTRSEMSALQPQFEQKLGAAPCAEAMVRGQSMLLDEVVSALLEQAASVSS